MLDKWYYTLDYITQIHTARRRGLGAGGTGTMDQCADHPDLVPSSSQLDVNTISVEDPEAALMY